MTTYTFQYQTSQGQHELRIEGVSTHTIMALFERDVAIEVTTLGATCYQRLGWATEKNLPTMNTVGAFLDFLQTEGDIGLIECEIILKNIGSVFVQDDISCLLLLENKQVLIAIVQSLMPAENSALMIHRLFTHPGRIFSS